MFGCQIGGLLVVLHYLLPGPVVPGGNDDSMVKERSRELAECLADETK